MALHSSLRFNSLMPWYPAMLPVDDTLGKLQCGTMPDSDAHWMSQQVLPIVRINVCNYIPLDAERMRPKIPYRPSCIKFRKRVKASLRKENQGRGGLQIRRGQHPVPSKG